MASNLMVNVPQNFSMDVFAQKLADTYRAKGFNVSVANMNGSSIISFEKGVGGINMILGMGEGIKATCALMGNTLTINYSDGDWTGKIIGLVVGWILCFIPFITAIVGSVKQSSLPKNINNDATMIISSM